MDQKHLSFFHIGFGYDSHRFLTNEEIARAGDGPVDDGRDTIDSNKSLIIGGVEIPSSRPFRARSDGDVAYHAVVNALLSALGKEESRDIGTLFPNDDKTNTNRSSSDFIETAKSLVDEANYLITDLKLTIKAKLRLDISAMRLNLARVLDIDDEVILIQATSGEDLGEVGKGLGVEVYAVCSLLHAEMAEKLSRL